MDPSLTPVVEETNANRATFNEICRSLSKAELAAMEPGGIWTAQDYIAHLATIDILVNDWFTQLAEGQKWRPRGEDGGPFNIDTWNDAQVIPRRSMTVDQVLDEAEQHRQVLWGTVSRFTPEILAAPMDFRGHEITLLRYLQLWASHDPAHTADMLRGLPERHHDPVIRPWLEKYNLAP